MVYETKPNVGITISVKSYRKSRGMKDCGRAGNTGKKARIEQQGKEPVTLKGDSFKDLSRQIRAQFNIPPHVVIKSSGVTCI